MKSIGPSMALLGSTAAVSAALRTVAHKSALDRGFIMKTVFPVDTVIKRESDPGECETRIKAGNTVQIFCPSISSSQQSERSLRKGYRENSRNSVNLSSSKRQ